MGHFVGTFPVLTIALSFLVCGIASIGMVKFKETDITEKLWVPSYSRIQEEKKWMTENFPPDTRYAKVIAVENNVLSPRSLNAVRLSKVSCFFVGFIQINAVLHSVFNLVCFFYINSDVITIFLLL